MYRLLVSHREKKKTILANHGDNILALLRKNGILVRADCGGNGTCKKCKVIYGEEEVLACQSFVDGEKEIQVDAVFEAFPKESKGIIKEGEYGIALDLGTTTLAAALVLLADGSTVEEISVLNPQSIYGADVISRIQKAGEGHLADLASIVIAKINEIIKIFKDKYNLDSINKMSLAGNTVMLHIITKTDPSGLGKYPFTPVFLEGRRCQGRKLGLDVEEVQILPSIGSFLGADISTGILACDLLETDKTVLMVDLGTNGEVILKTKSGFYGASTAAGPAFEGARIECGTGGIPGAIATMIYDKGELSYQTVADLLPIGICGSGLLDLISILVSEEIIDESGCFQKSKSPLSKYLHDERFYFYPDLYLSQRDVREFQLAKSAIASGIQTLMQETGTTDLDQIYLAGGFGFYLNKSSALRCGLLPEISEERIISVGNTSLQGLKKVLMQEESYKTCEAVAQSVSIIELDNNRFFKDYFLKNMFF
ncbi:MAG: DUF4445 domain-containing protein [Acholeplasmataceae bacterium]|nr:DUF4445 domain-containing protein [Acholeplasmataceae bacterium]